MPKEWPGSRTFAQESLAFTSHSSAESKLHSEVKTWHHNYLAVSWVERD